MLASDIKNISAKNPPIPMLATMAITPRTIDVRGASLAT